MKLSIIFCLPGLLLAFNQTMSQAQETDLSIGTAEMMADRSIVLMLRTRSDDGPIGEARFVYPMGSEGYQALIDHLGGLEPLQSKPVPPWPESMTLPAEP